LTANVIGNNESLKRFEIEKRQRGEKNIIHIDVSGDEVR
jgi:hypothetical protein